MGVEWGAPISLPNLLPHGLGQGRLSHARALACCSPLPALEWVIQSSWGQLQLPLPG